MLLSLRPTDAPQRPACAALLPSANPAAWLREITGWQLAASQLRCYLVPESLGSVQVAGLLVLAEGAPLPPGLREPYGLEAEGRLLVPTHAALWPAAAPAELAAALLWPRQLLHPSRGLVGFDTADELTLADLLHLPAPRATDWAQARPAPALPPGLQQLRIPAPTATAVVQQLQAEVASRPLAELPGLAASQSELGQRLRTALQRAALRLGVGFVWLLQALGTAVFALGVVLVAVCLLLGLWQLLRGQATPRDTPNIALAVLLTVLFIVRRLFPTRFGSPPAAGRSWWERLRPARPSPAGPTGGNWLQRAGTHLRQRLDNLEQQRQAELERLLQLFASNPAEALRYAIPLDSPYLHRGTAAPTGRLGSRAPLFNLGQLGGGQRVDAWDLGQYERSLRQQYQRAAALELAAGRYQQAAYIQAHLLGDFRAAAAALEQGGLFREAAALYRDHLHNQPAAAQCLERGGLLLEAADLYATLGQPEKAGDLHQQLGQPAPAARYYEQAATTFLASQNHLEAARVLAEKLADPVRAATTLLQGWAAGRQPEPCLLRYFNLAATQPAADLPAQVRDTYAHRTAPPQRGALLRVLKDVVAQHPAALPAAREVAYDVIGQPSNADRAAHLQLLRHFVPTDPLLPADLSRYATSQPRGPAATLGPALPPALDGSIQWLSAVAHGQQWVAVGQRAQRLHLARGNWHGQVVYHSWLTPLPEGTQVLLLADEQAGNLVLLRLSQPVALELLTLPRTPHFAAELVVQCPTWLPPWPAPVGLKAGNLVTCLSQEPHATWLVQQYSATGQPLHPLAFEATTESSLPVLASATWPSELLHYHHSFYTYCNEHLGQLDETTQLFNEAGELQEAGQYEFEECEGHVYELVRSPFATGLLLAATTDATVRVWPVVHNNQRGQGVATLPAALQGGAAVRFVGPQHLVVYDKADCALYQLAGGELHLVQQLPPSQDLLAALPTNQREWFALLTAGGQLTLHALPEA